MSQNSPIEWTEATWNPVRGCTKVSPGCANCYAETFAERWRGVPGHAYEQGFDLRLVPDKLGEPLRTMKPTTYFVNSMSDLFQDGVPDEFIGRVFDVMAQARRHTFQVLTKRADRMRAVVASLAAGHTARDGSGWPLPNVWLGVSVENQHFADERIPLLLQTPAAVRFISAEPLLGSVNLELFLQYEPFYKHCKLTTGTDEWQGLDWVIVGGESGHGARPFDVAWARSIVSQCKAAGVPVFVKQLGKWPLSHQNENLHGGQYWVPLYSKSSGREATGEFGCEGRGKKGDLSEWPADLRVREMPRAG